MEKIIFILFTNLKNNYIFSKYIAEKTIETYTNKIPWINVRLSNIYGPSLLERPDIVISIFHRILKKKKSKLNHLNLEEILYM